MFAIGNALRRNIFILNISFAFILMFLSLQTFASSKLCESYLKNSAVTGPTAFDRNTLANHYLRKISDGTNSYNIGTKPKVRETLRKLYERIISNPSDLNLLKAFWYTSRLLGGRDFTIAENQVDVATKILEIEGKSEENLYNYYIALREAHKFQASLVPIKELVKRFPGIQKYSVGEVKTLISLEQLLPAIEKAELILSKDPENMFLIKLVLNLHIDYAKKEAKHQRYISTIENLKRAKELLDQIFKSDQVNEKHNLDYAYILYNLGLLTQLLDFLEFTKIKFDFPLYHELILEIKAYTRLDDPVNAKKSLKKAFAFFGEESPFFKTLETWSLDFTARREAKLENEQNYYNYDTWE